ncbi:ArnT family glycosyltransferase [Hyphomicrobium sulfonivorans]|uniref:ArnT family glycosyltransferase n=1 Tax=Hyphomicrobium sulfonivorans TaxID=121290 RepID=UPI0015704DAA|nr:glycosyltransferase family 39 protein [Hyphomicrobium sulfonivorans]MBI1649390.1 glycosyltransferase family 39 protein [Hyphomicrobium sulfonivorans]NSL71307.1 glycosyl transferase family 39 [Hyphomicrobium sulfonivorans]
MPATSGHLTQQRDTNWFAVLLVGLAALLAMRLTALYANATDLFFDEAQYWAWSEVPALGYYSKPPLIAWIIGAATTACGNGEACVRLPSPLLHTATAFAIFWLGRQLYDARVGALSALAFATLPGVSLSAGIISTDVPLLLCWALALVGFLLLLTSDRLWPAVLMGVAFGAGLNAKYAMIWFVVCIAVYLLFSSEKRGLLRDWRLYLALVIGATMIAPNLLWNYSNSFATFSHTADNANWGGSMLHPNKALEFFGAQFGVFGPILFGSLLVIAWRARKGAGDRERLLLSFSLPIIGFIVLQAFLSRAHANWAAPAYVAATVLVIATMVRDGAWGWLKASFAINIAVLLLLAVGTVTAGRVALPLKTDPFARTLGWRQVAEATQAELAIAAGAGKPFAAVLSDDRAMTAELLYYMRDEPTPILAWRVGAPHDHFEMTRPFTASTPAPVLLVRIGETPGAVADSFTSVEKIADRTLPAGENAQRRVSFYSLAGYKGE